MAKEVGVFALPAVAFFKLGSKEPVIYAGKYSSCKKNKLKCEFKVKNS